MRGHENCQQQAEGHNFGALQSLQSQSSSLIPQVLGLCEEEPTRKGIFASMQVASPGLFLSRAKTELQPS